MLRPYAPNPGPGDAQPPSGCPSLIDLASFADGRLSDAEAERIAAHAARCTACVELLRGLRVDARAAANESSMLLVPAAVLERAMNLRTAAEAPALLVHTTLWLVGMRRGLAAAAALGIVLAGYEVGQSLTPAKANAVAAGDASSSDDYAFGLLDSSSSVDNASDLFALALTSVTSSAAERTEGTP